MPSILPAWRDGSGGRPPHFAFPRPHHPLKGRPDTAAVAASRQRLTDLKTRAMAEAIYLVFLDEPEALTPPYLARCRARRGADLRIEAPGQAKKRAMLGALDPVPHGSSPWAARGGSASLNRIQVIAEWMSVLFMPRPGLAAAG